jgi:hypothetical protein
MILIWLAWAIIGGFGALITSIEYPAMVRKFFYSTFGRVIASVPIATTIVAVTSTMLNVPLGLTLGLLIFTLLHLSMNHTMNMVAGLTNRSLKTWATEEWSQWRRWGSGKYDARNLSPVPPVFYRKGSAGERLMLQGTTLTNEYDGSIISAGYSKDLCPACFWMQIPDRSKGDEGALAALRKEKERWPSLFTGRQKRQLAALEISQPGARAKAKALGGCQCGFRDHLNEAIYKWETVGLANQFGLNPDELARDLG